MVGNDIIDINETLRLLHPKAIGWERTGFVQKIFTSKEQSVIADSKDPFTTVWHFWSMKESAYKVFIQNGGKRFFNPTKIECSIDAKEKGRVTIGAMNLKTSTSINFNYIFTSAVLNNIDIETSVFELSDTNIKQQSDCMHQHVLNDFAQNNSLNVNALFLEKTKTGVPTLYYNKKPLNASISITHHGKYGAYSFQKNINT
jgi:phosphopantetheinyl transferase (holo-ACP synthase)